MKISQIIDRIDTNQLFVPAFQREYVWKYEDAKKLIASLLRDYPTGTMLTWDTVNPPELKGNYQYEVSKGTVKIILDGQQRITTLYMLLKGEIPPYYTEHDIKKDIRNLYVNVQTLELAYYKAKTMQNNPLWVNITDIFQKRVRARGIIKSLQQLNNTDDLSEELLDTIDNNFGKIESIWEKDFLEQIVPVKATLREAIDIFYIVNASGVNLSDAELALAQISGYWPQARDKFKCKLKYLESQGWVFKLDFIVYALLAIIHKNGSKMEKLHSDDNKDKVVEAWNKLDTKILDYVMNLMRNNGYIDHSDEINSVYALIPIIAYVYSKQDNKLNENEIKKAIKWFYYAQIRSRYVSQLPQKLDKDISIAMENDDPFDVLLALIAEERSLDILPSDFIGKTISHPLFSLMKWYFKSNNAICLGTGVSLRKNMGKKYELEYDHIFAYSILRDSGIYNMDNQLDYALAQEVTNRALLTQVENREKSALKAEVYLKRVKETFPNALRLQCIPEDESLWELKNYIKFLEKRREILASELNSFLNSITVSSLDVSPQTDIMDVIQSGEHDYLEMKSSLRWNWKENKIDTKMEDVILKTIAAFSNKDGGKLLIGVTDEGEVIGLENDYGTLKEANKDYFEVHLRNLMNNAFGKEFTANNITVKFPIISETEICEIDIKPYSTPLYCEFADNSGKKAKRFYLRSGNTSQELEIDETASYISKRFGNGQ